MPQEFCLLDVEQTEALAHATFEHIQHITRRALLNYGATDTGVIEPIDTGQHAVCVVFNHKVEELRRPIDLVATLHNVAELVGVSQIDLLHLGNHHNLHLFLGVWLDVHQERWRSDDPSFRQVRYKFIQPRLDWVELVDGGGR